MVRFGLFVVRVHDSRWTRVRFKTKPAPEVRVRDDSTQYSLLNND